MAGKHGRSAAREALMQQLRPEQMAGQCREVAEIIGVEATIALCEAMGGIPIYLPKAENLVSPLLRETIRREYNGYNKVELAKKYDLAQRTVESYVQGMEEPPLPGQISIDELENLL